MLHTQLCVTFQSTPAILRMLLWGPYSRALDTSFSVCVHIQGKPHKSLAWLGVEPQVSQTIDGRSNYWAIALSEQYSKALYTSLPVCVCVQGKLHKNLAQLGVEPQVSRTINGRSNQRVILLSEHSYNEVTMLQLSRNPTFEANEIERDGHKPLIAQLHSEPLVVDASDFTIACMEDLFIHDTAWQLDDLSSETSNCVMNFLLCKFSCTDCISRKVTVVFMNG